MFFTFSYSVFVCREYVQVCMYIPVYRGQRTIHRKRVALPPLVGPHLVHEVWQQVPVPTEPTCRPKIHF